MLVLHDVTELRRLEVIRRDFVANVSHELRTPLTAIKGYAETLLGAAGDDRETARRFLAIIDRHSERLGRLIDDLLTLSDLELGPDADAAERGRRRRRRSTTCCRSSPSRWRGRACASRRRSRPDCRRCTPTATGCGRC